MKTFQLQISHFNIFFIDNLRYNSWKAERGLKFTRKQQRKTNTIHNHTIEEWRKSWKKLFSVLAPCSRIELCSEAKLHITMISYSTFAFYSEYKWKVFLLLFHCEKPSREFKLAISLTNESHVGETLKKMEKWIFQCIQHSIVARTLSRHAIKLILAFLSFSIRLDDMQKLRCALSEVFFCRWLWHDRLWNYYMENWFAWYCCE